MKRSMKVILSIAIMIAFILTSMGFATVAVKGIKLNTANLKLYVGKTYQLKVQFTPSNTTQKRVIYSSLNKSIATIDSKGIIKGVKEGKTIITVTSESNRQVLAKCNVTILKMTGLFGSSRIIKVLGYEHPSQPIRSDAIVLQEIFNKTGVKIKFESFPMSDWDQKARILIATNNLPEIMLKTPGVRDFARYGIFLPISDYIDKYAPNFKKLQAEIPDISKLYIDGKLYSFPNLARFANTMGRVPMIRIDALSGLSLKTPDSFEELYGVLLKFKEANPNSYPWSNRLGTGNLLSCIAYAMGSGYGIYYDKDISGGKYVYGTVRSEFKDILAYLNKLYKAKILDPDYAVSTAQQWQEKLSTGKSIFYFDNPSFAINFNNALQSTNPNFKFGPIPTLKNDKGQRRNLYYYPHWFEQATIRAKVKNPEQIIMFMDWLYSEEGADITNFGIDGVNYTKSNGEYKISKDLVEKHLKDSDPWRGYMSELGVGLLGFSMYVDERNQWPFMNNEVKAWYDLWKNDKAMFNPIKDPIFNKNEQDKLKELIPKVSTILTSEIDKFIMGTKPISDFDQVAELAKKSGAIEIEQIYNDAYARLK